MPVSYDDELLSRGAQAVRALLERHGIPKHRHSAFVGEFFELSRAAAHQRVSKSTAWTLEELSALAEHFGETLAGVVATHPADGRAESRTGIAATLCVGDAKVACRIWLRPGNLPSPHDAFVGLRTGDDHVVMPVAAVPPAHALRVARLELDQSVPSAPRVAVLDATEKATAALRDYLRGAGMDAHSLGTLADLAQAAVDGGFAAYVIDWSVARSKTDALLSAIRAREMPPTVILLCDRRRTTAADIAELAQTMAQYKAQILEKPVQLPLLASVLQNSLGA